MPSPERSYQPRPFEALQADYGEQAAQPPTSPRMEQVVTHLAAASHVDLSQPGMNFNLDLPTQPHRWMIANLDGERIGITRCRVDEEGSLSPDVDMVFAVTESGWEPREIIYAEHPWDEFAQVAQEQELKVFDTQGNLRYDVFTEVWAQKIEQATELKEEHKAEETLFLATSMDTENRPFDPRTENRDLLQRKPYEIIGKPGFRWRKELSEGGQKLYLLLLCEAGDKDTLPELAAMNKFTLNFALEELRGHALLDESHPDIIKLVRRRP